MKSANQHINSMITKGTLLLLILEPMCLSGLILKESSDDGDFDFMATGIEMHSEKNILLNDK